MPVIHKLVSSTIPSMRHALAWALSNHAANVPKGLTCQRLLLHFQLRLRITICSTSTVMRRILETSVQTMLPLLVHTVLLQIVTYALVGPALHLTPILCLRNVITLMTLCRYHAMPEPHTRPPHNVWSEVSDMVRLSVVSRLRLRFLSSIWSIVRHLAQSMRTPLSPVEDIGWQWMGQTPRLFSPLRILLTSTNTTLGTLCWSCYFTCRVAHSWRHILMKLT